MNMITVLCSFNNYIIFHNLDDIYTPEERYFKGVRRNEQFSDFNRRTL